MVGHPRRLLHVVRHDDDRHVRGDLGDGLLDPAGGCRVKGRAGLVHQQHIRLDGQGAGDTQPLLLPARQRPTRRAQPGADLVPQPGPQQAPLHQGFLVLALDPGKLQAARDVVKDRHGGERVGLLEDHADPPAGLLCPLVGGVDVLAVEQNLAGQGRARDELVHPVQDAQVGGLAAARGPDERRHLAWSHGQRHPVEDLALAEPGGDVPRLQRRTRNRPGALAAGSGNQPARRRRRSHRSRRIGHARELLGRLVEGGHADHGRVGHDVSPFQSDDVRSCCPAHPAAQAGSSRCAG